MSSGDSPEREFVVYDGEGFPRAPLEDEEGPSSESEDVSNPSISTEKPKSRRTPRREVRWLDLGAENRSLESIKRRFQDRLDSFLSSSSNYLLRHITSPMDSKQPRYPSQYNFQNMAPLPPLSSMDASNISEIHPGTYGYPTSHSGSPTQSGALNNCQWENCGEVFAHLATLIDHIHNGKFFYLC